ncbi:unnamed protein product, partial [Brenthis ino]
MMGTIKKCVVEATSSILRFLWFILTVAAFAGATYCALNQLTRYISEPVVVSLQRDYRSWTTAFPAVTVCYLERVDGNKAREFISRKWNITEESDQDKYQYYYEFIELIAEVSFRRNLQNFWKYQNDDSVNDIDLLNLALYLHPKYPMETITSDERNVQWVQVMTEEGLCQTFNGQYAQHQKTDNKSWKPLDLMTCHYHSETCYVTISSMTYAARYFIHSPFDIATAISNPTGDVFSGDKLVTDFKVVEIEAADSIEGLTAEQRRCKYPNEWLDKSIKAYSFGLCMMHCRTRLAIMFCGCRPYFHVKGARVCESFRPRGILLRVPNSIRVMKT